MYVLTRGKFWNKPGAKEMRVIDHLLGKISCEVATEFKNLR